MRTTYRRFLGIASAAVLAAGFTATSVMAQEITLRMHQFLPAQSNVPKKILDVWADKVEADSKGRIKVQRFPSMQLGGTPPQLIDQVIDGIADIVWMVPGYTPGRFPRTEVFELPFMMTNPEATARAYWELAQAELLEQDFKDIHVLALWVSGPLVIHSRSPIASLADLKGVKLRGSTRLNTMLFSAFGAATVSIPLPSVPEAFSRGTMDAAIIPWEVTGVLKIAEMVKNHTTFAEVSPSTTTFVLAMNKKVYAGLPNDLKKVIDANSDLTFSAFAGKQMQEFDEPARLIAVKRGNNIIELSPEQVKEWRAASQSTIDAWIAEMDKKGLDGAGLVSRARALIAKHTN